MDILAWLLALASLAIIVYIIVRKFPILANIDVNQIAAERQAELKKKILSDKLKRSLVRGWKRVLKVLAPAGRVIAAAAGWLYNKLISLRDSYGDDGSTLGDNPEKRLAVLFAEAQDLARKGEFAKAESKYIEIIGLDSRNYKAFELLAENYLERESYEEAKETLTHVIKLGEQLKKNGQEIGDMEMARSFFTLGLVYLKMSQAGLATEQLKRALELEPNNPRYLDKMVEVCIMTKDVANGRQYCQRLEVVNPGNKKLKEIKVRLRDLENKSLDREVKAED